MYFDNTWLTYFLLITIFVFWMILFFTIVLIRYLVKDYWKIVRDARAARGTWSRRTPTQYNANSSWHQTPEEVELSTDVVNEFWPHPH